MSADTNPGGGFNPEIIKEKILALPQDVPIDISGKPVTGIKVSQAKRLKNTNITMRYLVAEEGNPWNYQPGCYLVTNLLPEAFNKDPEGLSLTLGSHALIDLSALVHESSFGVRETEGLVLNPKYQGDSGQIIFQLG